MLSLQNLTLASTGAIFIGSTTPRSGQTKFVQFLHEKFVSFVGFLLGQTIPGHNTHNNKCCLAPLNINRDNIYLDFH